MNFAKISIALLIILGIVLPNRALALAIHKKIPIFENRSESKGLHKGESKTKDLYNEAINNNQAAKKVKNQQIKKEKRTELENNIKNYLGDNINNVGLSYYNITSGDQININSDKSFLAGSTVKVQLNMVLGDMFQNGQANKNEQLAYKESDYEEGAGVLQGADTSKSYAITTLSDYSIIHSDNIATNMIEDRIGYKNFRSLVDKKLGHTTDHSGNYITALDETNLLRQLYENKDKISYYSYIIDIMKKTDFHDRLDKYVDKSIVAHKIGDYNDYVNDVGIVYTGKPYIVSVYTKGVPNADEVIAHISKMIYDYQIDKD